MLLKQRVDLPEYSTPTSTSTMDKVVAAEYLFTASRVIYFTDLHEQGAHTHIVSSCYYYILLATATCSSSCIFYRINFTRLTLNTGDRRRNQHQPLRFTSSSNSYATFNSISILICLGNTSYIISRAKHRPPRPQWAGGPEVAGISGVVPSAKSAI